MDVLQNEMHQRFAVGTVVADRYTIEGRIGKGGMAHVYAAHDQNRQCRVAIKVIGDTLVEPDNERRQEFVERFKQEAAVLARINHPNIINIIQRGEHDGLLWFAMPYMENAETLESVLKRYNQNNAAMSMEDVKRLSSQLVAAVAALHEQEIIHRDIKPDNCLVEMTPLGPWLRLIDLGVCHEPDHRLTATCTSIGTPLYLSPEMILQWMGLKSSVDSRADLWAVGVCIYRMLTGEFPFTGKTLPELFEQISKKKPEPPSVHRDGITPGWDALVMRLLAKIRDDRYATARELFDDLQNVDAIESRQTLNQANASDECFDVFNTSIGTARKRASSFAQSTNTSNSNPRRLLVICGVCVLGLALSGALIWRSNGAAQSSQFETIQMVPDQQTIAVSAHTPSPQVTPQKAQTPKSRLPATQLRPDTARQKDPATYVWVRESSGPQAGAGR